MKWDIIEKLEVYKDYWKGMSVWKMKNENGLEKDISITHERDVAVILGITKDNKVLVIKEYFFAQGEKIISLPAGMVDDGMTPEQIATEELKQEAGCQAQKMIMVGSMYRGKYVTGITYAFLALGVEQVYEQDLEDMEDIEVSFVSMAEFESILAENKMKAMHEVSTAYMALDYLKRNKLV